ncbi:MAG TPA: PQQ-dependent sugar dehydrogenase [Nitrospiria bacterium]|nr:PQQ-dependent sugar dehydrogenase [Nitrospiria bacterium]
MRHDGVERDDCMTDGDGYGRGRCSRTTAWLTLILLAACVKSGAATGTITGVTLSLSLATNGLTRPIGVYNAGHGDPRLFVIEQPGRIRIVRQGAVLARPFLDLTDRVDADGSETGLLGMAFHHDYPKTGFFFVNYTSSAGGVLRTRISRFSVTADPNLADPSSEKILFTVDQPFANHNAGDLHFGPDGLLYIPLGDGGSGGDPHNNAQTTSTLLGKIVRIDVDAGPGAPPDCTGKGTGGYTIPRTNPMIDGPGKSCDEIWAMGLRNPWRSSFDRRSGDLYLADVGQEKWEEIDRHAVNDPGGQNYGWRCYEGTHLYNADGCRSSTAYVPPIFEYGHENGNCAVIGGYVYRGDAYPAMAGRYLMADYCSGTFWDLASDGRGGWRSTPHTDLGIAAPKPVAGYTSFGEDAAGELYVTNINTGALYRLEGRWAAGVRRN